MHPLTRILAQEISETGPIPFSRYMEAALYHPEHGYYRRACGPAHDPFGRSGDYFTAEQLQPVFGRLVASYLRSLAADFGPGPLQVIELGAGRGEMADAFAGFDYVPIDVASGVLPDRITGFVFANEFFDALPVDVVIAREGRLRELRVDFKDGRFLWVECGDAPADGDACAGTLQEGAVIEVNREAFRWLRRMAERLDRGFLLTIDYGYECREIGRFPGGTLMSYRKHLAIEDVLTDPGSRDLTAHVSFTDLQRHGRRYGLETIRFETLSQMILRVGEDDEFATVIGSAQAGPRESIERHRLQLKTLLFGMGESFRVLLQGKGTNKDGPDCSGPRESLKV